MPAKTNRFIFGENPGIIIITTLTHPPEVSPKMPTITAAYPLRAAGRG